MNFDGLADFGDLTVVQNIEDNAKTSAQTLQDREADHALVFQFSSLRTNFVQPIGMFMSRGPTDGAQLTKLILAAIVLLEKAGGRINAIVCDGASPNRKVWTNLGCKAQINQEIVNSFDNPADVDDSDVDETDGEPRTKRQVYVLSDSPHLIKCVRNLLLTRDFKVK